MPFISEPLDDVREPQPAPEGEYDIRIIKAIEKPSKAGRDMLVLTFAFSDKSIDSPPFNHYLLKWDPLTDEADQVRNRKLELKRFCAAFDLDEDFEVEDCLGQEASLFVMQEVGDDNVVRNRARFPRLEE